MNATHIVGGELTYRCLGDDQYEINLTVFRDCYYGQPWFDNPASVGFFDQNNHLVWTVGEWGQILMDVRNNDTLSPILENECFVLPPDVCVHTTTYKDTVTLPFIEGGYFLSYQRCCRNETILNIVDPTGAGASFTAKITEKALLECNNSATFNEWPPLYICANQPIHFDHSATDLDGDSLVYKLCEPIMGVLPGRPVPQPPNRPPYPPVNWSDSFSLENKLGGDEPLAIDYQTGLITGTPTIIGQFVVGVCVEEYRDGELISTTNRDFQYNVGECETTTAAFFNAEYYCDQLHVDFENLSDASAEYEWYFGGIDNPIGFSDEVNPTFEFPDFGEWEVTLVAIGNIPDCNDTITRTVQLLDIPFDVQIDIAGEECSDSLDITLYASVMSDTLDDFSYLWNILQNEDIITGTSDSFNLSLTSSDEIMINLRVIDSELNCWHTLSFPYQSPYIEIDGAQFKQLLCGNDSTRLLPFTPLDNHDYHWSPEEGLLDSANTKNPWVQPEEMTLYTAEISNELCEGEISVLIGLLDPENRPVLPDTICGTRVITFDNNPFAIFSERHRWRIFYEDGTLFRQTIVDYPTITFPEYGNYTVELIHVRGDLNENCPDTMRQDLHLFDWDVDFDISVERGFCEDSVQIFLNGFPSETEGIGSFIYEWIINDDTLRTDSSHMEYFFQGGDSIHVQGVFKNSFGCEVRKDTLIFSGLFYDFSQTDTLFYCPGDTLMLNAPFSESFTYEWLEGPGLMEPFDIFNPLVVPDSSYVYQAVLAEGDCSGTYAVYVHVLGSDIDLPDIYACELAPIPLSVDAIGISEYFWVVTDLAGDTVFTSNEGNPMLLIEEYGHYNLDLYVYSMEHDCETSASAEIFLYSVDDWEIDIQVLQDECVFDEVDLHLSASVVNGFPYENLEFEWEIISDSVFTLQGDSIHIQIVGMDEFQVVWTAFDSLGCSLMDTLSFQYDFFVEEERDTLIICRGDSVFLNPNFNPDYDYVWSPAEGLISGITAPNPLAAPADNILYTAEISTEGCDGRKEVYVIVNDLPIIQSIDADPVQVAPGFESMLLVETIPPDVDVVWIPQESLDNPFVHNPIATPEETTTYIVTTTTADGCVAVDSITVFVEDLPCEIPYVFLPNAFSPNGDGVNDILYVRGEHIERFELIIYNRWGQKVFRTTELDRGWNGTFNGEELPPDVFGYHLEVECIGGEFFSQKGNVTLAR